MTHAGTGVPSSFTRYSSASRTGKSRPRLAVSSRSTFQSMACSGFGERRIASASVIQRTVEVSLNDSPWTIA